MSGAVANASSTPNPPSVHFVNNVLAAAAGAIDEDPVLARDTLARLGALLAVRLRPVAPTALADELELVETYLALEEARFPGRVHAAVSADGAGGALVRSGSLQEQVERLVSARLAGRSGACRVRVRVSGADVLCDLSDFPNGEEPVRHRLVTDA